MTAGRPASGARASGGSRAGGTMFTHSTSGLLPPESPSTKTRSPKAKLSHNSRAAASPQQRKAQAAANSNSLAAQTAASSRNAQSGVMLNSLQKMQQNIHQQHRTQQTMPAHSYHAHQQMTQASRGSVSRGMPNAAHSMSGQQHPVSTSKRARSTSMNTKEPDAKRAKPAMVATSRGNLMDSKQAMANSSPNIPTSPTSSRSRSRKQSSKAGRAESDGAHSTSGVPSQATSHDVSMATTAASGAVRGRVQNAKVRQNQARPMPGPVMSQLLSVDGLPIPSNIKARTLQHRLFGQEIQCIMHSFGETRFCARDTLELVEDAVRDAVRRVAIAAAAFAAEQQQQQHLLSSARTTTPAKGPVVLQVWHVAHLLRRDARAIHRLNDSVKLADGTTQESKDTKVPRDIESHAVRPPKKPWDVVAELASLPSEASSAKPSAFPSPTERLLGTGNDPSWLCTVRALHVFHSIMHTHTFNDYRFCRSVTFVRNESRSRVPQLAGQPRIALFRDWLGMTARDNIKIPDLTLHALGHVAWETVGLLTQSALVHKYFDDVAKGLGDPRASSWSTERHILAALGYGIATAIMIPLSDAQCNLLRQELEHLPGTSLAGPERWRGLGKGSSPCLLPCHIREALRRVDVSSNLSFYVSTDDLINGTLA